jgi:hypothetical protein
METIQFEGVKTALKQTKDGYMLTIAVHPDMIPDDLVRDFVGARYMVVMARLGDDEQPYQRVRQIGVYCRNVVSRSRVFGSLFKIFIKTK